MFFFNDTATTEIYTLSLHDGSSDLVLGRAGVHVDHARVLVGLDVEEELAEAVDDLRAAVLVAQLARELGRPVGEVVESREDRKSTRLNSSHANISYAVFCLKKKKH